MVTDEQIRELAYYIWEQENRLEGKDLEYYFRAKQMLEEREAALSLAKKPLPLALEVQPPVASKPVERHTDKRLSMNCPRCKGELRVEKYRGIEVDRCAICKGIWLDYGELDQLEDTVFDKDEIKGSLMYRSFRGDLLCPKCQRPMLYFSYRAYDLELDFCDQQHGVWLDAGEEKRVLELMEQRGKDLNRKARAEAEWSGLLGKLKTRSFLDKVKDLFRK